MPEVYLEDVLISQSHVTTIDIPAPGNITIMSSKRGYGSIYKIDSNPMVWVCNLSTELINENITLQPGNYKIVFRSTYARKSVYTIEREFQVISGAGASVKIY